uniref:tetratricopeptide repeat protein n=1 Tax=Nostoc flagelliforme TaxID=1306274 RepID=UPI001CED91BB|nr:tetratricopeptide repeat protein [Nostoc flagelliforme]
MINLLVVTARPNEEHDVGYRTISRPLLELIESCQLRVNVELLRPGTYEALSKHLEAKGAGFYHVIHFDCHGALMRYNELEKGAKANRYIYQTRWGRYDLQPYEGVKAFLFFEGESKGKADPVEAQELADLLTGKGIPVCILNACQSGKQVKEGKKESEAEGDTKKDESCETSLGSRLMIAGMQMVVAMAYSVTVSAAKIMMEHLYRHLFDNININEAIRLGRRELFMQKRRKAYFNQTIDLEDWLLPVVYSNKTVKFNLRQFTPQEEEEYFASIGSKFRFAQPEYGFFGRDLEILKIEKALLRQNILLLQGMGGTGKSTLLNYLRQWWQITNFSKDVFYFAYDQKAWTLAQILFEIAKSVYDRFELAQFQSMNQSVQLAKLAAKLRADYYVIILDNFESITGQELAVKNILNHEQQQEIQNLLIRLLNGNTRVVVGSRSREDWLQTTVFKQNIYQLQGLEEESCTILAEKILERNVPANHITEIRQDEDFKRLMKLLGGYPLAMEVVLANLKKQSSKEILSGLQAADINLDSGSEDKTKSILKCVEYSHSNLSSETQELLLCLAPFNGFIWRDRILDYINELKKLEPFINYTFDKFDIAIQESINWGLLSHFDNNPHLLIIQPVLTYFLKTKFDVINLAIRDALYEAFKSHYINLAGDYYHSLESQNAQEQQLGMLFCDLEYENLYNALEIFLYQKDDIRIFSVLHKYLIMKNDILNGVKLAEFVCARLEDYPNEFKDGELGYQIGGAFEKLAYSYTELKQYEKAQISYEKALEIYTSLTNIEKQQKQEFISITYHQLGMISQELHKFEEAKAYYRKSLHIKVKSSSSILESKIYHNLGVIAQELRNFSEARKNYCKSLAILEKLNETYHQAITYHELGRLAYNVRKFNEAKSHYQKALNICINFNDYYNQAKLYHQLGLVAYELRELTQAQSYYYKALEIKVEFNDRRYSEAVTYQELGRIAQQLGEFEEARRNYQKALEIRMEFGEYYSLASNYNQLGRIAAFMDEFKEAQDNYQKALEIFTEFGDYYGEANVYLNLGNIAHKLCEFSKAQLNYQQVLKIANKVGDMHQQACAYSNLGILANDLGKLEEAKYSFLLALNIWSECNDEYYLETIALPNIARLYQATKDESLLVAVVLIIDITVQELREAWE